MADSMRVLKTACGLPSRGKPQLERGDAERPVVAGDEERHGAARARVAERVRLVDARDGVAAAARVEHALGLLGSERAKSHAHVASRGFALAYAASE